MPTIQCVTIDALKPNARNARTHSKKQIRQIADSITAFGFVVPVLVNEKGVIISGHGRYAASKLLGIRDVPAIEIQGLSEAKRRALALADNRIAEAAGWDRELLAAELPELADLLVIEGLDIAITGFAPVEIDQLTADFEEDPSDPADTVDSAWETATPVTKPGDLWQLGNHRLLCGDARGADDLAHLMGGGAAAMAFLDPPYNVRVRDIVGRGQVKHAEFAMASGELSRAGFVEFLKTTLEAAAAVSREGERRLPPPYLMEMRKYFGTNGELSLGLPEWGASNRPAIGIAVSRAIAHQAARYDKLPNVGNRRQATCPAVWHRSGA